MSAMILTDVVISSSQKPINEWVKFSTVSFNAGLVNMLHIFFTNILLHIGVRKPVYLNASFSV